MKKKNSSSLLCKLGTCKTQRPVPPAWRSHTTVTKLLLGCPQLARPCPSRAQVCPGGTCGTQQPLQGGRSSLCSSPSFSSTKPPSGRLLCHPRICFDLFAPSPGRDFQSHSLEWTSCCSLDMIWPWIKSRGGEAVRSMNSALLPHKHNLPCHFLFILKGLAGYICLVLAQML